MKNQPLLRRLGFALGGIAWTLRAERSFRIHIVAVVAVAGVLVWLKPAPFWWAAVALACAAVLAAELFNTAIENLADHLHPEVHPGIRRVKDCAAAAVLVASFGALAVAAAFAFEAFAATLDRVDLTETDGRYQLVADSWLDAPPAAISAVLLNFEDDAYREISEIYQESDVLEPDADGTPLVYTRVRGCVMLFCRSISRVERLEVVTPTYIRSAVVPERSDLRFSTAEWTLTPEDGGTRVQYRMALEPDFWLPPMIGPTLLRQILLRGGVEAVDRIEELAQEEERVASR